MTDPWCWYINANMTGGILMGSMLPHIAEPWILWVGLLDVIFIKNEKHEIEMVFAIGLLDVTGT